MSTEMTFREPVACLSAMQLKDMPLTEMLAQIEVQERQASKEKRLGSDAAVVLEKLRSGIPIVQGGAASAAAITSTASPSRRAS